MIGGHQFASAIVEPLPAILRNPAVGFQERFRGDGTEANDDFGRDHLELPQQEGRAGGDFAVFGRAILGRAAFDHVADVNVFALQAHRFDHLRQKFSGSPHKRQALRVFVRAWSLSDKDEFSFRISITKDDRVPVLMKPTTRALTQIFANL